MVSKMDMDRARPRERRSGLACGFCKYRKLKCDNTKPQCGNCRNHNKDCVYVEGIKKARPSNARIAALEEENRRLQELVAQLSLQNQSQRGYRDSSESNDSHGAQSSDVTKSESYERKAVVSENLSQSPSDASGSRSLVSSETESQYHGPTSALFDETYTLHEGRQMQSSMTEIDRLASSNQLLAESARQRQLEKINYATDKLDFDGVDKELGMHLLSLYWDRQLYSGMIVYRTAFMRDMACGGPYYSKLLLNAIFFTASKYSARPEFERDVDNPQNVGVEYRQRATELLAETDGKSSITTIQALLVMTSYLFTWHDEQSISWRYSRLAFSMIIDLGIHAPIRGIGKAEVSPESLEIRRRVLWGAYYLDKLQSLYLGRPVGLRESDVAIPLDFLDEYEELEPFNPASYSTVPSSISSPTYSLSTLREFCKLSMFMDRILATFYSEKSRSKDPDSLLEEQQAIYRELELWRKQLPAHLSFQVCNVQSTAPLPHVLCLHTLFHLLTILLHRPFLSTSPMPSLSGHLHSKTSTPGPQTKSFLISAFAASQISSILSLWTQSGLNMFRAPHLISYATYVSATIHLRIAAQRSSSGSTTHAALKTCLDILQVHAQPCLASRRALGVILQLKKQLEIVVGSEAEETGWHEASLGRFALIGRLRKPGGVGAVEMRAQETTHMALAEAQNGTHGEPDAIVIKDDQSSANVTFELVQAELGDSFFDQDNYMADVEMTYDSLADMNSTTLSWFNSREDDLLF